MVQLQPEDVPLFDYSPRISRLRYLSYSAAILGLLMLPGLVLSKLSYSWHLDSTGRIALAVSLLLVPVVLALVTVPRLHDLGRGGGWALIPLTVYAWLLFKISPVFLHSICVPLLFNIALFSPFALLPGKRDGNRFGLPPSPDTRRIRISACIAVASYAVYLAVLVSGYLYKQYENQKNVDDAMVRATGAETEWREYFRAHRAWPDPVHDTIPRAAEHGFQYWRSRDGAAFVIDAAAPLDDGILHYYPGGTSLRGVAVWTTDGGESWHCSPVWISRDALPESCRDSNVPAYTGPI